MTYRRPGGGFLDFYFIFFFFTLLVSADTDSFHDQRFLSLAAAHRHNSRRTRRFLQIATVFLPHFPCIGRLWARPLRNGRCSCKIYVNIASARALPTKRDYYWHVFRTPPSSSTNPPTTFNQYLLRSLPT